MLLSFGKEGDTVRRGIILEDDSAGHYFVLRDFIPINLFKKVTENVCGKQNLSLKTVGDTFFCKYVVYDQRRDWKETKEILDACS